MLVDDQNKKTLFYASTLQKSIRGGPDCSTIVRTLSMCFLFSSVCLIPCQMLPSTFHTELSMMISPDWEKSTLSDRFRLEDFVNPLT